MDGMARWIRTDKHVYGAIYREHHDKLRVFGSCSAPEGDMRLGITLPYMLTEWGFEGSDAPLIKSIATKDSMEQKDYDYKYYIALIRKEECDCE